MNAVTSARRALVAALTSILVASGLLVLTAVSTPAAGATCTTTTTQTLSGRFALDPGAAKRRVHRNVAFTNGSVAVTFTVPRNPGPGLYLVAAARTAADKSGYRASVRVRNLGDVRLGLLRVRDGVARELAGKTLGIKARPGDRVRVRILTRGDVVRAKAWRAGTPQPRWQLARTDANPVRRSGLPAARAYLSPVATSSVAVRYGNLRVLSLDPSARTELGVYNGLPRDADGDTKAQFGSYPDVANSYYQHDKRVNRRYEAARINRGTSPNITITTKGTQYIAALATGPSHPNFTEANSWLNTYVGDLKALAKINPNVPVYATFDHEFRGKVRRGEVTGASADPVKYGEALSTFYKRAHAAHRNIRTTYWFVGYDRTFEGTVGKHLATPPNAILFDPYANSGSDSISSITSADLSWIRSQSWYVGQEIALAEFGMGVRFGDAAMAQFYANARSKVAAQGLSWAVFFNRERDEDTRIAGRSDGKTFPQAVNAFSSSLAC